jgi:hypothetical protein
MALSEEREKELAADLRDVIEASGETLEQIADGIGVDRTTLWKWKRRPTTEGLPKLALFCWRAGRDALAAKFLTAFFDEYPELSGMVVISPNVGRGSSNVGKGFGTDIATAGKDIPLFSSLCPICDKREKQIKGLGARALYDTLDDVLDLGDRELVASISQVVQSFVRCVKKLRSRK